MNTQYYTGFAFFLTPNQASTVQDIDRDAHRGIMGKRSRASNRVCPVSPSYSFDTDINSVLSLPPLWA